MKRPASALFAAVIAVVLLSPQPTAAAAAPVHATAHHATLGPLAQTALSATAHGRRLPSAWVRGRATRHGTTYGVFLRGTTTSAAIAATGAVPGTVLSVGSTAEATLGELNLLAALPGVTEVELAGQAKEQLDQSVPAIHASEPAHTNTPGVPHLWSGTGGSDGWYISSQGGALEWQDGTTTDCPINASRVPVLHGGLVYDRNAQEGNFILDGATGADLGTFSADLAPAFDGTTGFYVSGGVLTARNASGTALWAFSGDGTSDSAPITAPIVVNGNVFVGAGSGKVFALPVAGNGTPAWVGDAGAPILAPTEDTSVRNYLTTGLGAAGGMLIVPATGSLVAFGDSTVTASSDTVDAYQVDAAHDGDQPNDSLTVPLAATPKWTVPLGALVSSPMIAGGKVFVLSQNAAVPPVSSLYALNESDGSVAWGPVTLATGANDGLGYDNGQVFVAGEGGIGITVTAYSAETGAVDWSEAFGGVAQPQSPVATNGVVYVNLTFGGSEGELFGLSESTGAEVQFANTGLSDAAAPAVSSTGVYFGGSCTYFADYAPTIMQPPAPPTFSGDTGQGTIVGIVDTGIDLTNPDFRTNSGTRIVDLWDQAACPDPSGNTCPVQPPNSQGFDYGAECSQGAINASACGPFWFGGFDCEIPVGVPGGTPESDAERDCDGHGTHVAGIAASDGRAAPWGTYIGVAPQADLVVVKNDGNLADVIDGVDYIFKVAAARGEPASVNISLGTNQGPHDGSDVFETMLDALTGPGKLVSVAGGNEATNDPTFHYHASGAIADGQVRTDGLAVQAMPVFLDLWYPGADSLSAAISETGLPGQTPWVSPDTSGVSGEDGTCIQGVPGQDAFQDPEGNTLEVLSCTHMPSNGMNEIQVAMFNPNNGAAEGLLAPNGDPCGQASPCVNTFHILFRGNSSSTTPYNAWTVDQGDYFFYLGDGNDRSTLDEPGSAHDVITVGSYVTRNSWPSESGTERDSSTVGHISDFSGEGPTLDGRTGIDIVAPGEEIGSSLSAAASVDLTAGCPAGTTQGCESPDGNHLFLQGTSMAAPHVAGAMALLLEQQPTIDVTQAKSLLAQSANQTPLTSGGAATTWGAGKLEVGPGVLSISAATGPLAGGNTIDITGVDLQPGVAMSLGGHALTLTSLGPNEWSAPVPATTEPGAVSLSMTNTDGSTGTDPDAYVYLDPTAYHSLTPYRACDTRSASSTPSNQCKGKTLGTGRYVAVQITGSAVPTGSRAVAVNLTVVNHSAGGTYVTAYPAGGAVPRASNINQRGPGVATNLVIVQLGAGGAISVFNAAGTVDVIIDVQGYFAAPSGSGTVPGEFHSMPPLRICDTRANGGTECAGSANNPLSSGSWRDVVLSGLPHGVAGGTPSIPADGTAAAAVFNLTATQGTQATYLSVQPPNSSDHCPTAAPSFSNVNPEPGTSLPNRVISPLGSRQDICVFNSAGRIDFIIDVDGWFGNGTEPTAGALFNSVAPTRICDTRTGSMTECAGTPLGPNVAHAIQVAGVGEVPLMSGAPPLAFVANLTAVAGNASTYFTLYPSDVAQRPRASDLNPVAGEVIANLSIVGIAQTGAPAGDVSLYNAAGSINAILDVAGWFQ